MIDILYLPINTKHNTKFREHGYEPSLLDATVTDYVTEHCQSCEREAVNSKFILSLIKFDFHSTKNTHKKKGREGRKE